MIVHHDKPIGVDSYFREIFAGDTVRDQDGKEYTIDERGYAKSLDGVTVTGFKRLKDPVYVGGPDIAAKFQEKDGKVGPAETPKPAPRVRLAPIAKKYGLSTYEACKKVEAAGFTTFGKGGLIYIEEKDIDAVRKLLESRKAPAESGQPEPEPEKPKRRGGRENKTGVSQLGNLVVRLGYTVKEAREILIAAGIEVFQHGPRHKACIHAEDLPKVRELLRKMRGEEEEQAPGNHGNHRPNVSGVKTFNNIARSLRAPAWELRDFAKEHGFAIVRHPSDCNRNDGLNQEDEARFRELWAAEHGKPERTQPQVSIQIPKDALPLPVPDKVVKTLCSIDTGETRDWNLASTPDRELAEELRRRGYEVKATKRIEL